MEGNLPSMPKALYARVHREIQTVEEQKHTERRDRQSKRESQSAITLTTHTRSKRSRSGRYLRHSSL